MNQSISLPKYSLQIGFGEPTRALRELAELRYQKEFSINGPSGRYKRFTELDKRSFAGPGEAVRDVCHNV